MTRVTERADGMSRLENLKKMTALLPGATCNDALELLRTYLKRAGWRLDEVNVGAETHIRATASDIDSARLWRTQRPQIVTFEVSPHQDGAVLRSWFNYAPPYLKSINGTYRRAILFSVFGIFVGQYIPQIGVLVFGVGFLPALLVFLRIASGDAHRRFYHDLHTYLYDERGYMVRLLGEASIHPSIEHFFHARGVLLLGCLVGLFSLDVELENSKAPLLVLGGMVIGLMSILTVFWFNPHLAKRTVGYLPLLLAGLIFSVIPIIPLVLAIGLEIYPRSLLAIIGVVLFSAVIGVFVHQSFGMAQELRKRRIVREALPKGAGGSTIDLLTFVILPFWLLCSAATVLNIYFTISGIENLLLGENVLFQSRAIEALELLYGKIGVASYVLPVSAIALVILYRALLPIPNYRRNRAPGRVDNIVRSLCEQTRTPTPRTITTTDGKAHSYVSHVFGVGPILHVSTGLLDLLSEEELRAVLAHELFHIKRHSKLFAFIDFLSQWTYFGKGFLAVAFDTRRMEFDADTYSVNYLEGLAGISRDTLSSALEKIAGRNSVLGAPNESLGMGNFRWLFEIYFGDLAISYLHPTTQERIQHIRELP